ncbi:hypothetical protein N431DRAFT_330400, partial [Stipitochalara longipes BDJ]
SFQMALKSFRKFPKLDEDCRLIVWQLAVLDEKVVEVKPRRVHLGERRGMIKYLQILNSYVSQEARKTAFRTLHFANRVACHNFIFYMNMSDCGSLVGLERPHIKIPGSISDPLNSSNETILSIPLHRLAFNASFKQKTLEYLTNLQDLEEVLIIPDLDFQQTRTLSSSTSIRGDQGIAEYGSLRSRLAWDFGILQAYGRACQKRRALRITWSGTNDHYNIQIVRWQVFEDTNIGWPDLAAEVLAAED